MKSNFLLIGIIAIIVLIGFAVVVSLLFIPKDTNLSFANSIAIIPIKGEITSSKNFLGAQFSSREIVKMIEDAENDPLIGAVVFDIDSPGGSVVATKEIVYKIRKMKKPSVSYIGDIGTSGAYYIAAATDYIIADSDSITGSIGVFTEIINVERLLHKIGIDVNILQEGKYKTMGSIYTALTEEEKEIFQQILKDIADNFKADILEFRKEKIDATQFEKVADGRILSGRQALKYNLIDSIGTFDDAIEKATELAKMSGEPQVIEYGKKGFSILDLFMKAGYNFGVGFKYGLADTTLNGTNDMKIQ